MAALDLGLSVVQEATELDKAGQYRSASALYATALVHFGKAVQETTNPKSVALIKSKMLEYRARRDEIKHLPDTDADSNNSSSSSSTPTVFSSPPAIDWGSLQEEEARRGGVTAAELEAQRVRKQQIGELDQASTLVERATQLDAAKRFGEALPLYEAGLERFMAAYQLAASSPPLRKAIKQRMELYMSRAEQLKKWLNSKKTDVSAGAAPHLSAAIDTVQRAIELDNANDARAALPLYERAVEHFRSALQSESNANTRQSITDRMITYTARIQQLEQTNKSGAAVVAPIQFGLATGAKYVDPTKKKGFFS
jgi:tetratricopeptide (TPR) repeat protein